MHSEHLRNVQLSWVAFGWFAGLAIATGIALFLVASGVLSPAGEGSGIWLTVAVGVGWFVGGFTTGYKTAAAPILHGTAIALFTFVAWFLLNLVFGGLTTGASAWELLGGRATALALLEQAVAAIAGCWAGYRYAPLRVE
ncbi:MAG: hypothetical protein M8860_10110 [marine benthic group bacterium]|jgi:hypothetical protein|nr:hypothetical protein [Gemmatimonadota bacterium]MCL7963188.1 hypothetical protein [Candidatus Carthagonibacter metallireducens]MCL7956595.1 hypothetical protein [Gemmatimonadota bacterium]MCL7965916.1 hypothetical protein [Gemmatimonadota bacterium]MCL7969463.1 hypothetical protein [Gemmatimonadota bacterium]